MTDQTNVQGANDTALQEGMKRAKKFGEVSAKGTDARPMMAIDIAQMSAAGVLSDTKDADGNDDVARYYNAYAKAVSTTAVYEAGSVGSTKAQASKLRQVRFAAAKPTADFVVTIKELTDKRAELVLGGAKQLRSTYDAIVDASRTQNAQDDPLTPEQVEHALRKPEPADKTMAKELAAIEKKIEDLLSGEKGVKCDDPVLETALASVREVTNNLTLMTRRAAFAAEAAALGVQVEAIAA